MKKIINGKLYNTQTAKCVGFWCNGGGWGDFNHYEESLYRKKTGEFFLFGEGGAMSKYSRSCGQNSWCGGEEIIPLTYEKAQEWAEKKLDADEYMEIFGEVSEDDEELVFVGVRLTKANAERMRRTSEQTGRTIQTVFNELIERNM